MRKYKVGDRVKVKKYGHPIFEPVEGTNKWQIRDLSPELVGAKGTIIAASTSTEPSYGIHFDDYGTVYWFFTNQIKRVRKWWLYEMYLKYYKPGMTANKKGGK